MKHTLNVLVQNQAGVLAKVSGLFGRRGYNIDSLPVGMTEDEEISRITMVVTADEQTLEQIKKQLNKLIDTIKVKALEPQELLSRELQLIKINATSQQRSEILTICEIMGAKIADISATTLTLEISDTTQHLDRFQELIKPYGIKEIVRTGVIAIQKGAETIKK